ncbi:MAG: hypothetical protein HQL32_13570 [Planctomycetes bacterium]|nr:hypothetical protein [Planctomycetota bacterium]
MITFGKLLALALTLSFLSPLAADEVKENTYKLYQNGMVAKHPKKEGALVFQIKVDGKPRNIQVMKKFNDKLMPYLGKRARVMGTVKSPNKFYHLLVWVGSVKDPI